MSDETQDDNDIVCPYCGYKHGDAWEYASEYPEENECHGCGEIFERWKEVYVTYHARKVEA